MKDLPFSTNDIAISPRMYCKECVSILTAHPVQGTGGKLNGFIVRHPQEEGINCKHSGKQVAVPIMTLTKLVI